MSRGQCYSCDREFDYDDKMFIEHTKHGDYVYCEDCIPDMVNSFTPDELSKAMHITTEEIIAEFGFEYDDVAEALGYDIKAYDDEEWSW